MAFAPPASAGLSSRRGLGGVLRTLARCDETKARMQGAECGGEVLGGRGADLAPVRAGNGIAEGGRKRIHVLSHFAEAALS